MNQNPFGRKIRQESNDCKIKIKNTAHGQEIQISKNCTKEQIEMAKKMYGSEKIKLGIDED